MHINLLVTLDGRYVEPLSVLLNSYAAAHTEHTTDLYVLHSSLSRDDIAKIQNAAGSGVTVINIEVKERWFSKTPVLERLPEESFYRLLAFHILPESVEKCLYLDPDIIIRGSLAPLYETDISQSYIAAAGHMKGFRDSFNKMRLGISGVGHYINSGVMLMNLKKIREDFTLRDILASLEENIQRLMLGDQDLANILFGEKILYLDERLYNLDERTLKYLKRHEGWDVDTARERSVIIHYNGKYKPWLMGYRGELDTFYPEVENKGAAPRLTWLKHIKSFFKITKPTLAQATAIIGMLLLIAVCIISYATLGKELVAILSDADSFRSWLGGFGGFGELIFVLIRAAQTVVKFIPAEPLEIASGYAWGAVGGMLLCLIGNLIGTLIIFALVRRFGERIVGIFFPVKRLKRLGNFEQLYDSKRVYPILFLLYLIPGSPKDGFTYIAGLLPIKLLPFLLVTFIARIPSVLSSTLCGGAIAEGEYLAAIIIFVATAILAIIGGVLYKKMSKPKSSKKK